MSRANVLLLSLALAAAGCRQAPAPQAARGGTGPHGLVRIAAAADLRFALDAMIARLHEQSPELDVRASYGSSGTFFAQLANGAPFDVFLSADLDYPKQLAARGLTLPSSEFTYAIGRVVLWAKASSPLDVEHAGIDVLADRHVAHIAIANPEHAPYGRAAVAVMKQAGVYDRLKDRVVLGENVSQALQFVQSGAADVGLIALSLAVAPTMKGTGKFWRVPGDEYPRMEQGGVVLKSAADIEGALTVRDFLQSDAARDILTQYGFGLPERRR